MAGDDVVGDGYGDGVLHSLQPRRPPSRRRGHGRLILRPMGPRRVTKQRSGAPVPAGARSGGRYPPAPSRVWELSPPPATPCHPMATSTKNSTSRKTADQSQSGRRQDQSLSGRRRDRSLSKTADNRYRHDGYQEGDDGGCRNRGAHPHDGHGMNQPVAAPSAAESSLNMWPTRRRMCARRACLAASSGPRDVGNPTDRGYDGRGALRWPRAMTSGRGARGGVRGPVQQPAVPYPQQSSARRQRGVAVREDDRWNRRRRLSACTTGFAHFPPLCTTPRTHRWNERSNSPRSSWMRMARKAAPTAACTVATTGARTAPRFPPRSVAARIASTAALDLVRAAPMDTMTM